MHGERTASEREKGRDSVGSRPDLWSAWRSTGSPRGRPCPCASACRATSRPDRLCLVRLWSASAAPFALSRTPSAAAPGPQPSYLHRQSWRRRLPASCPWPFLPSSASLRLLGLKNIYPMMLGVKRPRAGTPVEDAPALSVYLHPAATHDAI